MKKTLLILLTLFTNFVNAQTQVSDYYDASSANRPEFSYNITVRIQKTTGATAYDTRYTATLAQASPDSKGFYNANGDRKFYTCSQLGNVCNPNNLHLISVRLSYTCNGQQKAAVVVFKNLNDVQQINVVAGAGGKFCESIDFNMNVMGATLEPTHLGQIIDKINQLGTSKTTQNNSNNNSNNPVTQTGTTNTGIPANTSGNDPLAHFEPESRTNSNPMTNSSSGSARADNISRSYQQGQQLADATMPILQGWVDARNARIDREIAQDKSNKDLYYHNYSKYDTQVEDITNYINSNYDKYLIGNIPYFFNTVAKSWDNLLGSDYNIMFGKSFAELKTMKSFRRAFSNYIKSPKDCHNSFFKFKHTTVAQFYASTAFYTFDMPYELNGRKIKYQGYSPIFNEDDVLIGIKLKPRNSYGEGSAVDYQSDIEGYIKDMKQDLGDNFIMLNGNTYLYKDKLIIFEYDRIIMFDTNALKNRMVLRFKDPFYNQKETIYFNIVSFGNFGFDCGRGQSAQIVVKKEVRDVLRSNIEDPSINVLTKAISEKTEEEWLQIEQNNAMLNSSVSNKEQIGVLISKIEPKGVADKKGLKEGDAIISVNGYKTDYIYQLQLALRTNLSEGKYSVTYLRDNVEYTAELTSNSK